MDQCPSRLKRTNGPESSSKVSPYTGVGPWMVFTSHRQEIKHVKIGHVKTDRAHFRRGQHEHNYSRLPQGKTSPQALAPAT